MGLLVLLGEDWWAEVPASSGRAPALMGARDPPVPLWGLVADARTEPAVPCRGGRKGQESRFLLSN